MKLHILEIHSYTTAFLYPALYHNYKLSHILAAHFHTTPFLFHVIANQHKKLHIVFLGSLNHLNLLSNPLSLRNSVFKTLFLSQSLSVVSISFFQFMPS